MARICFLSDQIEAEVPDTIPVRVACEEQGASLPFGCEEGFCGTCTMIVRAGQENLSPPNEKERERLGDEAIGQQRVRLGCQAVLLRGTLEFENG